MNRAKTGIIGWGLVVGWWLVVGKKRGKREGESGKKGRGGKEGKKGEKAGVILLCQNGYYDRNIKVLLIVVKYIEKLRYH